MTLTSALENRGQIVSSYEDIPLSSDPLIGVVRNAAEVQFNGIIIIFKSADTILNTALFSSITHSRVTQLCGTWLPKYNCPVVTRSVTTRDQLNAIGYRLSWVY